MNRFLAAISLVVVVLLGATAASAQVPGPPPGRPCFTPPGPPPSTPPCPYPPGRPLAVTSGQFNPGGTGTLRLVGAQANAAYPAVIRSHNTIPVNATANPGGVLVYADFPVPADFELNAEHSITFESGELLTFCVNRAGAVFGCGALAQAPPGSGNLARTGSDTIDDAVRVGASAVGAGALLLLWRRRRAAIA